MRAGGRPQQRTDRCTVDAEKDEIERREQVVDEQRPERSPLAELATLRPAGDPQPEQRDAGQSTRRQARSGRSGAEQELHDERRIDHQAQTGECLAPGSDDQQPLPVTHCGAMASREISLGESAARSVTLKSFGRTTS